MWIDHTTFSEIPCCIRGQDSSAKPKNFIRALSTSNFTEMKAGAYHERVKQLAMNCIGFSRSAFYLSSVSI